MKQAESKCRDTWTISVPKMKVMTYVICVTLCACHIILLSVDYFKYQTVTLYGPYIPFEQTLPRVTFCLKFRPEYVKSLKNTSYAREPISQSKVINNCHSRNFTSKQLEASDCSQSFVTFRTIRRRLYDCYTIKPNNPVTYMIFEAAAVLKDRRVLYTFSLSRLFESQSELISMMHFKRRPNEEFRYASHDHIADAEKNISIEMGYRIYQIFKLPFPYNTNCVQESICLDSEGIRHEWCKNALCSNNITKTMSNRVSAGAEGIHVEVRSFQLPSVRVKYAPQKRWSSFFFEMCSLLGVWLGVSVKMLTNALIECALKRRSPVKSTVRPQNFIYSRILNISKRLSVKMADSLARFSNERRDATRKSRSIELLKRTGKFFILILFLREVYAISQDFFRYKTRMNIEIKADAIDEYPSVCHCIDIYVWFGRKQPSHLYRTYDEMMTKFARSFNFTLREMYEKTPSEENAIDKCDIRRSASSPLETVSDCNGHFNVTKFFFGQFMCYRFEPRVKFIPVSQIEQDISVTFSIMPTGSLAAVKHYRPIVSYGVPVQSRRLVSDIWKQHRGELVELAFRIFKYVELPLPYDTKCSHGINGNECKIRCINLEKMNLIHFSLVHTKPVDLPVLDYVDLKNETIADFVEAAEKRCRNICSHSCEASFTNTVRELRPSNYSLQLTLLSPKYPVYFFTATPVYSFGGYVYQVTCSASFWIGFSVIILAHIACKLIKGPRQQSKPQALVNMVLQVDQLERKMRWDQFKLRRSCSNTVIRVMQRIKKRFTWCTQLVILCVGFCVHSTLTTSVYFEYPTVMDTRLTWEHVYSDLRPIVCISIDQLNLQGNYSLRNIWVKSPSDSDVMVECGHRGVNLPELSHLPLNLRRRILPYINSTSLCYSLLKMNKFITLGLVCFEIEPETGSTDTEYQSQHHIGAPRVYEYLILTRLMSRYNLTVAVSQGPSINTLIMPIAIQQSRPDKLCQIYYVTYVKYFITSLPYPYNMGVYDSLRRIMCMRNCLGARTRAMGVFSPYDRTDAPSDLQHEVTRHSVSRAFETANRHCQTTCKFSKRHEQSIDTYYNAVVDGPFDSHFFENRKGSNSLWFATTGERAAKTVFYPELRLVDLVIFVGSIFSVWFGLSVLETVGSGASGASQENDPNSLLRKLNLLDKSVRVESRLRMTGTRHTKAQDH